MNPAIRLAWGLLLVSMLYACSGKETPVGPKHQPPVVAQVPDTVRFATFNAPLNRLTAGPLANDLTPPNDRQASRVAQIIQRTRPQVLLLNTFDFDPLAVQRFTTQYLALPQSLELEPIVYPYAYQPTANAPHPSMLLLSQFPIDTKQIRTFRTLRWADMPGNLMPHPLDTDSRTQRLSWSTHGDVPVLIPGRTVHVLISRLAQPTVKGENRQRNHDEIRLWADYLTHDPPAYLVDDSGVRGGLNPDALCVILGDLNADPFDGESLPGSIDQLLDHPRLVTVPTPASRGAIAAAQRLGGKSWSHVGPHMTDTAELGPDLGNLRVDYALPSKPMRIRRAGIYWTTPREPWHDLMKASNHRMVWVDLTVPGATSTTPSLPLPTKR